MAAASVAASMVDIGDRPKPYDLLKNDLEELANIGKPQPIAAKRLTYHAAQQKISDEAKRFNVLDLGRRFGKTKMLCDKLVETAIAGYPAGYFAPSYKYLVEGWRDIVDMVEPIIKHKSEAERRIVLTTGGIIDCWSLDSDGAGNGKKTYKSGRGRKYMRVVIDEAAYVPGLEQVFEYAIYPTLLDYKGDAWFASTPNGKGGFYRLFRKGQKNDPNYDPEWASWRMPTVSNTTIDHIEQEVAKAKKRLPDHVFRQEYLAEFLEDSGQVFRNLSACTQKKERIWQEQALPYHTYLIAWDLAKKNDFSVIGVIDCTTKSLVHLQRFNEVDYLIQIQRLVAVAEQFQPLEIVVEKNGNEALMEILHQTKFNKAGKSNYFPQADMSKYSNEEVMLANEAVRQMLMNVRHSGQTHMAPLPIREFNANNSSKEAAIQRLVLAFEREEITIPDDPVLLSELEDFGMEKTPTGRNRYSAPAGSHDDTVMMLAEGWSVACYYASEEAIPARQKALKRLSPELQPGNIELNPNPMAEVSQQYWVKAFESEQKAQNANFFKKMANFGQ
jgi:hypothetical protein